MLSTRKLLTQIPKEDVSFFQIDLPTPDSISQLTARGADNEGPRRDFVSDGPALWTKKLVPGVGVEPTRPCGLRILSPLRMPFRHPGTAHGNNLSRHLQRQNITGITAITEIDVTRALTVGCCSEMRCAV